MPSILHPVRVLVVAAVATAAVVTPNVSAQARTRSTLSSNLPRMVVNPAVITMSPGTEAALTVRFVRSVPRGVNFQLYGAPQGTVLSAFPGTGYNRLQVAVTGPGTITVSNVVFVNPTQITATFNTTGAPAGTYTVTVTNPDGQSSSSNFSLTGNCLVANSGLITKATPAVEKLETANAITAARRSQNVRGRACRDWRSRTSAARAASSGGR